LIFFELNCFLLSASHHRASSFIKSLPLLLLLCVSVCVCVCVENNNNQATTTTATPTKTRRNEFEPFQPHTHGASGRWWIYFRRRYKTAKKRKSVWETKENWKMCLFFPEKFFFFFCVCKVCPDSLPFVLLLHCCVSFGDYQISLLLSVCDFSFFFFLNQQTLRR
jgi:hypothetical protein